MLADLVLAGLLAATPPTEPPYDVVPVADVIDAPSDAPPGTVTPLPDGTAPAPRRDMVFPVLGPTFYSDSFGDCREECSRHHLGIDLTGVQMQPLVATVDGTVTRIIYEGVKSGNGIVITDADGWSYVYYHVNNDPPGGVDLPTEAATADAEQRWRMPPSLAEGSVVTRGQVIGWMGNSGNAETSVVHLHFEIRDPDGVPVNPYTSLRAAEFSDRCRPAPERVVPVTSPPHVVQGTIYRFPTSTGFGQFTISAIGGVLAEGDAATFGNPNHPVANCFGPAPEAIARAFPDPDADGPDTTTPDTGTAPSSSEPGPDPSAADTSAAPTTVPGDQIDADAATTTAPATPTTVLTMITLIV